VEVSDPADGYDRLLRAARPAPRPEFVRELECALLRDLPSARRTGRSAVPVFVAGLAFAVALLAVVLVLATTGLMPPGLGRDDPVQAGQEQQVAPCRIVVTAPERVGHRTGRCPDPTHRADPTHRGDGR